MKKAIFLCVATMLFATNVSARGMMTIISVWFELPAENAQAPWLKTIEKPTPDKPKAMKNSIYFEMDKITLVNKDGAIRTFYTASSGSNSVLTGKEEAPRILKIPDPKATPKDDNDFVATLQIYKKVIVLHFKDETKPMIFKLKA